MMDGTNRIFGLILKKSREKQGLTQDSLAKKLNLSRVSVANYESGKQSPPLEHVVRAAIILNFSLDELKDFVEKETFDNVISSANKDVRDVLKLAFEVEGGKDGRTKEATNRKTSAKSSRRK